MTFEEIIAKRINELCLKRKIALNELAKLSGLRRSTLENIMNSQTKNPALKTLHRIAVGLNMTIAEFLDYKEMNEVSFEDEAVFEGE